MEKVREFNDTILQNERKMKIAKEGSILSKRGRGAKILFGIIFVIFLLYAISLLLPFVFLITNSLKGSLEYLEDSIAGKTMEMPDKWLFTNYIDDDALQGVVLLEPRDVDDVVDGLLLRAFDERAGVDDDHIGVAFFGGQFIARVHKMMEHDFGVAEVFGTSQRDEPNFNGFCHSISNLSIFGL